MIPKGQQKHLKLSKKFLFYLDITNATMKLNYVDKNMYVYQYKI